MNSNNICKFSTVSDASDLSIMCFVLESSMETMRKEIKLTHDRMILITDGKGKLLFDGTPFAVSAGTVIFGFQGEKFVLGSEERINYVYIEFDGARGRLLCHRFGIYPHSRVRDKFESIIPLFKDTLIRTPSENIDIAAEGLLLYVISSLSAESSSQDNSIRKIIEFTDENFRNPDLSISLIADNIGYNPKYISHLFKSKMNISYSEYLRSLRFKYAISLFELGISSVKNVALLSGFSDPFYFSNAFKKSIGISPKEFIATHTKNNEHE